jgi:hypothetical protein
LVSIRSLSFRMAQTSKVCGPVATFFVELRA